MDAIEELLQRNSRYAADFDKGHLASPPAQEVAVLACMDARMDIHRILGVSEGAVHVIRNAGGIASDDALRSLLISQRLLGTKAVMVIQHTGCGMLGLPEDEVREQVERETGQALDLRLHAFGELEEETAAAVTRIRSSVFLPHRDQVRGFVYDVKTGRLREVEVPA